MSQNDSDSTCVSSILDHFKRKLSPNRLAFEDNRSVATKLDFGNESVDKERTESSKRMRWSTAESGIDPDTSQLNSTIAESSWELKHLKKELIGARSKIASLETRVNQLHALRRELEVVFEAEKNSFLQQEERDRMMIKTLENRIATLRRRESDVRDGTVHKISDLEDQNMRLEKLVQTLRKEKSLLTDEILELKHSFRNVINDKNDSQDEIKQLKEKLRQSQNEKLSSPTPSDSTLLASQNERLNFELKDAHRVIKDLESKIEDNNEASAFVKAQQQKLLKVPEMERELENLRKEVAKLRDTVHNKLLLEEEVADLRQKCASSDERIQRLVQLEAQQERLESKLKEWGALVQDFCTTSSDDSVCPSTLRKRLQELQQSELLLTSEVADLQTMLKSANCQISKAQAETSRLTLEVSRLKTTQEQQGNLIRRWQRKLALITGERNSYREQLDSYEKELTMPLSSQQQSSRPRIEALEKSLEGYRELVENLEADLSSALGQGGSGGLLEKLRQVTAERDALIEEKSRIQKQVDELQIQMEQQVIRGDFNPVSTRVLHLRMNPVASAEEDREQEITLLRTEVAKLRERVKVLLEGERDDITCKVDKRVTSTNVQEVQELREQVKSAELMMQRLKEAFKRTSSEFRDCIYNLLGFKVDRLQNKGGLFRLSSMYAESPNDYLLFKMEENSTFTLLETSFSESVSDFIDLHLRQQGSLPVFHAAVTMDLFSRQSMMMVSAAADDDEPIVVSD